MLRWLARVYTMGTSSPVVSTPQWRAVLNEAGWLAKKLHEAMEGLRRAVVEQAGAVA